MHPPFSFRRLAASRLLRVMAVLGWLLTTISLPVAGAMASGTSHSHAATVSMTMDHADTGSMAGHHADECCGSTAHPACHCEAMCGSVLLPAVPTLSGPVRLAEAYIPLHGVEAPAPDLTPPLRPPAA
jgi:hypothetical protein